MHQKIETILMLDSPQNFKLLKQNSSRILFLNDSKIISESEFNSFNAFLNFIKKTYEQDLHVNYFIIRQKIKLG